MTLQLPIRSRTLFIFAIILFVVILIAWTAYRFDQASQLSEQHTYSYTIDLSYTSTIDNVTLILPVPELNSTPMFITSLLDRTAYGVSPDWNISVVHENGTQMLAIRADRMVPEYHGYPIAIEPGASVLPTTRVPGHEYSADTPVLLPVTVVVMEPRATEINTRRPVNHEPVFFPEGMFTPGSNFPMYDHPVPVYVNYTSERPVAISLRVSVHGSNGIWRGGWVSNAYSDSVVVEIADGRQGWIQGEGKLVTAEGR
jgi:hypothetical protein